MQNAEQKLMRLTDTLIVNTDSIRWIEKHKQCYEVCIRMNGCSSRINTHSVCKGDPAFDFMTFLFKRDQK